MSTSLEHEIAAARRQQAARVHVPDELRRSAGFEDRILRLAEILSMLGAALVVVAGIMFLLRGELVHGLVSAPLAFVGQAALAVVFRRVRRIR